VRRGRVGAARAYDFGRGAARAARLFDLDAITFVPAGMSPERLAAVEAEGATLVAIDGGYDDALAAASAQVRDDDIVLSDSSWPGFGDVPRWVTDGYATVFEEVDDELASRSASAPDLVVVPLGTGALAAAAAMSLRTEGASDHLRLVGVEPQSAACFSESVLAGRRTALPDPAPSVMTWWSRGLPSPLAFGPVAATFDGFVALDDDDARAAADQLVAHGVQTTPSGAAPRGARAARLADPPTGGELGRSTSVLVVNTEGPTRVRTR
jgi:diaminopropionate ammonia-lyase